MNKTIIIIAAVVILLIGISGYFIYKGMKKSTPKLDSKPVESMSKEEMEKELASLKSKIAGENYVLFNAKRYAERTPKPDDADKKLSDQQALVTAMENRIKELTASLNA